MIFDILTAVKILVPCHMQDAILGINYTTIRRCIISALDSVVVQWVLAALSPRINRSGHEADHSPPYSAEIKNAMPLLPHASSWRCA
jgi:hypothetical protein